eukprot:Rhum_TRINITY_DN12918_c0_g1::Rhum_TRINITY_DN12918_c0_g1_i1::g.55418::m.55418/K19307/BMT5; 25S rRNA (uracil2634-N3)-methyltransferase
MDTADLVFVLGDGNFSYTAAVMRCEEYLPYTQFVAGTLNPTCWGNRNVETIRELGGTVIEESVNLLHCDDVNYLSSLVSSDIEPLLNGNWTFVIFNFPHTGVGNRRRANVPSNQRLLRQLFKAGKTWFGSKARIAVTLKRGKPYDDWDLLGVAEQAGWEFTECSPFPLDTLRDHGYTHETTLTPVFGNDGGVFVELHSATTYVFKRSTDDSEYGLCDWAGDNLDDFYDSCGDGGW